MAAKWALSIVLLCGEGIPMQKSKVVVQKVTAMMNAEMRVHVIALYNVAGHLHRK
ncbi:uncharacterized protein G2W53_043999 [Senna tora]|uniref:Uncharacterized protein n=1 Tax=Senna tora TaxID=362788 RepID=A0A834W0N7_9FABA|nr:uncharacterized protein G2W53_043999 [Senna tora]